ncbi:MAG: endonuclease/exonuclease/phosphatase family protein [Planctomycetia bacterium]|nr:endonuclease/exonuclease/phosphatase family protein [Planctomycetia bacterium]
MDRREYLSTLLCWGGIVASTAWIVGQIWRDASWLTGLCFYLPSPLLAVSLLFAAAFAWRSARRWALGLLVLACGPLAFVALIENRWTQPPVELGEGTPRRLVHWNVFDGKLGWERILTQLEAQRADAYVLSEVTGDLDFSAAAATLGSGFTSLRQGSLAIIARGTLTERVERDHDAGQAWLVDWQLGNSRFSVLVVDLPSSIWIARRPLLEWVIGLVSEFQPDLVVGDFNAPRRSNALAKLPAGYRHAYDLAGSGWSYTWPVPAPCRAIDQCLVSPRLQPFSYELRSTAASDHRMQIFDFQVRPTAFASAASRTTAN